MLDLCRVQGGDILLGGPAGDGMNLDQLDTAAGGRIKLVQIHTVARRPAEEYVTALNPAQVEHIAALVRQRAGLPAEAYYTPED